MLGALVCARYICCLSLCISYKASAHPTRLTSHVNFYRLWICKIEFLPIKWCLLHPEFLLSMHHAPCTICFGYSYINCHRTAVSSLKRISYQTTTVSEPMFLIFYRLKAVFQYCYGCAVTGRFPGTLWDPCLMAKGILIFTSIFSGLCIQMVPLESQTVGIEVTCIRTIPLAVNKFNDPRGLFSLNSSLKTSLISIQNQNSLTWVPNYIYVLLLISISFIP